MKPLGVFGRNWFHADAAFRSELERMRGVLDPAECPDIANYLRESTMLDPFMEHTSDLLGGRFGVSGGSAVMADDHYYWRLDTAEYVDVYRVALPPEFLELGRQCSWTPVRREGGDWQRLYARYCESIGRA